MARERAAAQALLEASGAKAAAEAEGKAAAAERLRAAEALSGCASREARRRHWPARPHLLLNRARIPPTASSAGSSHAGSSHAGSSHAEFPPQALMDARAADVQQREAAAQAAAAAAARDLKEAEVHT